MNKLLSMFGIKIRFHSTTLALFLFMVALSLLFFFFVVTKGKEQRSEIFSRPQDDEIIDLVDLFAASVRLIHRAGSAIATFHRSANDSRFFNKPNGLDRHSTEPVTLADFLSHKILFDGLKKLYPQINIVSEEKEKKNTEQIDHFISQFDDQPENIEIPQIKESNNAMKIHSSSLAIWIDPLDATQEFTENLLQYVTVMLCVTVDQQPTIGLIYAPFTKRFFWGWVDVDHSIIERDVNNLMEKHRDNVDEIVVSRSHAGRVHQLLKDVYRDGPYQIIAAAGSGYKTMHLLEQYSDYYLHLTPIKKWDVCAPDALLRSNRGRLTNLHNFPIVYDDRSDEMIIRDGLVATYKRKHGEIIERFRRFGIDKLIDSKSNKVNL